MTNQDSTSGKAAADESFSEGEPSSEPLEAEAWYTDFAELKAEKNLKEKLSMTDPGSFDFSEEFFNQLHDKVMAQVQQTEIKPVKRKLISGVISQRNMKVLRRSIPVIIGLCLMTVGSLRVLQEAQQHRLSLASRNMVDRTTQAFVDQAVRAPSQFSDLMFNDSVTSDFFVDLADNSLNDLTRNDLDRLLEVFGKKSANLGQP